MRQTIPARRLRQTGQGRCAVVSRNLRRRGRTGPAWWSGPRRREEKLSELVDRRFGLVTALSSTHFLHMRRGAHLALSELTAPPCDSSRCGRHSRHGAGARPGRPSAGQPPPGAGRGRTVGQRTLRGAVPDPDPHRVPEGRPVHRRRHVQRHRARRLPPYAFHEARRARLAHHRHRRDDAALPGRLGRVHRRQPDRAAQGRQAERAGPALGRPHRSGLRVRRALRGRVAATERARRGHRPPGIHRARVCRRLLVVRRLGHLRARRPGGRHEATRRPLRQQHRGRRPERGPHPHGSGRRRRRPHADAAAHHQLGHLGHGQRAGRPHRRPARNQRRTRCRRLRQREHRQPRRGQPG